MSLSRFHDAHQGVWPTALAELQSGRKESHWMWFIFPQLRSLGRTDRARFYGIADLAEARAYLADPVLQGRLVAASEAVLRHSGKMPEDIMGGIDAKKLRSSMTLFAAAGGGEVFRNVISTFYDGPDPLTLSEIET